MWSRTEAHEEEKRLGCLKTRVAGLVDDRESNRGGEQQFCHQEGVGGSK